MKCECFVKFIFYDFVKSLNQSLYLTLPLNKNTIKMKNYLKIIKEKGLAIRQIPNEVRSLHGLRHHKEGQKIVYRTLDNSINYKVFKNKHEGNEDFIFDDKTETVKRIYTQKITIPKNAGYWLCKKVSNTSSMIQWSIKDDNLAPTLEESIDLFLTTL